MHHWSLNIEVAQFVYQESISKLKHEKQQFLKTEEVEKEENTTKLDGWYKQVSHFSSYSIWILLADCSARV